MNVVFMDLPTTVRGFVVGKDDPTIVLNARLSHEANIETCKHELKHIERDDFERFNVEICEIQVREENNEQNTRSIDD